MLFLYLYGVILYKYMYYVIKYVDYVDKEKFKNIICILELMLYLFKGFKIFKILDFLLR